MCFQWKNRSLSLIGKVLILNIQGLSKLLFVSSILSPPPWVCDKVNQIIWPFLWGSRVETVAPKSLVCPDLVWLITLRAVKVWDSLRSWGYISTSRCASCSRVETIDHCFLNCWRAKSVWAHFIPLLLALLSLPFIPNCAFVLSSTEKS